MRLKHLAGQFGICQLPADAKIPDWVNGAGFSAIIRSDDELTLVCPADRVPSGQKAQFGWACFRSIGPFGFDEAGIVAALITPISAAGIGVFVVCTFDGEHILYPEDRLQQVVAILTQAGHRFEPD